MKVDYIESSKTRNETSWSLDPSQAWTPGTMCPVMQSTVIRGWLGMLGREDQSNLDTSSQPQEIEIKDEDGVLGGQRPERAVSVTGWRV